MTMKRLGRAVPRAALVAVALALAWGLSGCFPKDQIYGLGNEGGLIFRVNPEDAEVLIDGVAQGPASAFPQERYLKVSPGNHRLELRRDGFETHVREIHVTNSLLRVEATLIRK